MQPAGFDLLLEAGPLLVAGKPGGLLTQAPPGIDSLEVRLRRFLKQRDAKEGGMYLATLHRLDRPVSGCVAFARHVRAAQRVTRQFESRRVRKLYWAVVEGRVEPAEGEWSDFLRKVGGESRSEITPPDAPDAQYALLRYRVLAYPPQGTWLEIELETGRTHQIRLQAGSRGHPVLGDELYGAQAPFGPPTVDERQRCIALHARLLALAHPMTDAPLEITAPLPELWAEAGLAGP